VTLTMLWHVMNCCIIIIISVVVIAISVIYYITVAALCNAASGNMLADSVSASNDIMYRKRVVI